MKAILNVGIVVIVTGHFPFGWWTTHDCVLFIKCSCCCFCWLLLVVLYRWIGINKYTVFGNEKKTFFPPRFDVCATTIDWCMAPPLLLLSAATIVAEVGGGTFLLFTHSFCAPTFRLFL
jgi:hypothetical protein